MRHTAYYRRYIIVLRVRITCSTPSSSHFHSFFFFFYFSPHTSSPFRPLVSPSPSRSFISLSLSFSLSLLPLAHSTGERASEYKPSEMTMVARVPRDTLCLRVFLSTEVRSCTCAHSCTACAWKSDAEGGGGSVKRAARNTHANIYTHTQTHVHSCVPAIVAATRASPRRASALLEPGLP